VDGDFDVGHGAEITPVFPVWQPRESGVPGVSHQISDILIRSENALARFRSGEAAFLTGQRPIPVLVLHQRRFGSGLQPSKPRAAGNPARWAGPV
jgi:hypothetical protein